MTINRNYYQGRHFITINKLPTTQFFIQKIQIPGITIGSAIQATRFGDQPLPGDKIAYNALNLSIIVDEDLQVLKEIKSWINENAPTDTGNYDYNMSDIVLNILNNNDKENIQILFKNCFIEQMNDIQIDTTNQDPSNPYILDCLIRYGTWDFI